VEVTSARHNTEPLSILVPYVRLVTSPSHGFRLSLARALLPTAWCSACHLQLVPGDKEHTEVCNYSDA